MAFSRTLYALSALFLLVGFLSADSSHHAQSFASNTNALETAVRHLDSSTPDLTTESASSVSSFLWRSFRPVPSSARLVDSSVESTWQQRARRFQVVENWASNLIFACWRGFSALILLKGACMLSNMIFQISPYPIIKTIVSKQDTGDTDAAPLICIAFGCCQWTFYGTFAWWATGKIGFLVLVYANIIGAVLGVMYVMVYHINCKSEVWWGQLVVYYRIAVAVVFFQVLVLCMCPRQQALLLVGTIASTCSLLTAIAPLAGLPRVIKVQCSKSIPMSLVLASMASALLWAACGIQLADPMITWPNMIGIAANTILLFFAAYYPQEEKLPLDDLVHASSEKQFLCNPKKEGYEANFNTFAKDTVPIVCTDGWKEHAVVADSSGGTF